MNLTIAKVDEVIFKGEAISLSCSGVMGDLTILPHHAPLVTPLKQGEIVAIDKDKNEIRVSIEGGILEVAGNEVTVIL